MMNNIRIGQSTDIHRLVKDRDLVIGGIKIPFELGLLGHSDGDALTHAIIEAIIGAMGLKDIGTIFKDDDPNTENIYSIKLLEKTKELMEEKGYELINIDSLIIIEKPKMAPFIDKMRETISKALKCDVDKINIKATCGEGLGFVGEEKGAIGQAVVLLEKV